MKRTNQLPIKLIYNFTYRLSGNIETAKDLTEQALLMSNNNYTFCNSNHDRDLILLKQAWTYFMNDDRNLNYNYDGYFNFQENSPVQQLLLSLPPEVRCAVILRDIFGYTYRQISAVLSKLEIEIRYLISMGRQEISKSTKKIDNTG
ncbi:MAG: sigma factor-like helix-turn-helix DNA-binding protein [Bacillota bacterium]